MSIFTFTSRNPDELQIIVRAASTHSIASVTAKLDGQQIGTLTAPNLCGNELPLCPPLDEYQFLVDPHVAHSGTHTVEVTATNTEGISTTKTAMATIDNPPLLTLTAPFDGALASGTLQVSGTFSSDQPANITVEVKLGSTPVLSTTSSPFSTNFNLAGVAPGQYVLNVTARDDGGTTTVVTKTVVVMEPSPTPVLAPVAQLGPGASLISTNGPSLLYSLPDNSVHMLSASSDVVLPPQGWSTLTSGGHVFGEGTPVGATVARDISVYMLSPGATTPVDLSTQAGSTSLRDLLSSVQYPWVCWVGTHHIGTWDEFTLYNVETNEVHTVGLPAGADDMGAISNLAQVNGKLVVFYSVHSPVGPATNVMRWDQATGQSVAASTNGTSDEPQTDGTHVVWRSTRPTDGDLSLSTELTVLDLSSSAKQVLTPSASTHQLADGLLGWVEETGTSRVIRAWDGLTTSTVSTSTATFFLASSGGNIVFTDGEDLYTWSPAAGRRLLLNARPYQSRFSGKTLYLMIGDTGAVYRFTLN